jgi:hypothetical protein
VNRLSSFIGVAISTSSARVVLAMARDAAGHRRNVGHLAHDVHLCYLPMARFAGHLRLQMGTMIPVNPTWQNVDSGPRDGGTRLCKLRELLNGGPVLGYGGVAGHAS